MPTNGQEVKIAHYTRSKFNSLTSKDNATIYYVEETDGKIKQYIGNTHVVSDNVPWTGVSGKPSFAPSNAQKNSDITKAEIVAKLTGLITTHTHNYRPAGNVPWAEVSGKPTTLSGYGITNALSSSLKGSANGLAELGTDGKVPSLQLPSYVDDVLEYDTIANLPTTGESGKIYITQNTNKTYRWSGSGYVEISQSLALGETSSTAYRGDRGKIAYDHSQVAHAPSNAQKNRTIATTPQAQTGGDNTTVMTPLRVKEVLTESPTLDLGTLTNDGSVNIGNLSSFGPAISIDGANDSVAMKGDWNLLEGSLIGASGSWKQVYGGPSGILSETTSTILTLQQTAVYYNRPMMMEIKYGSSGTSYTNQIVTFNLGDSTATTNSKTYPRTVSITDFDGRYFKTISVNIYPITSGVTNSFRVGYVKTLIGDFTGSSGTLTWTTESSDSISVYIGKIWVMV